MNASPATFIKPYRIEWDGKIVSHAELVAMFVSTFKSWKAMKARCSRKSVSANNAAYRDIAVCARWRRFDLFLRDMGPRPEGRTLDRIDSSLDYEPGNCRWATPAEQVANRRPYGTVTTGPRHKRMAGVA